MNKLCRTLTIPPTTNGGVCCRLAAVVLDQCTSTTLPLVNAQLVLIVVRRCMLCGSQAPRCDDTCSHWLRSQRDYYYLNAVLSFCH